MEDVGSNSSAASLSHLMAAFDGLLTGVATLTGGAVSIEDTASHVVAYSQSGADADDVRRQTILLGTSANCGLSEL